VATAAANGCAILSEGRREFSNCCGLCSTTDSLARFVESLAGSFLVIYIDVHANPIPNLTTPLPERLRSRKKPTVFSIGSQYAELVISRASRLDLFCPIPARGGLILRMHEGQMGVPMVLRYLQQTEAGDLMGGLR
jgi:hypothetical protein